MKEPLSGQTRAIAFVHFAGITTPIHAARELLGVPPSAYDRGKSTTVASPPRQITHSAAPPARSADRQAVSLAHLNAITSVGQERAATPAGREAAIAERWVAAMKRAGVTPSAGSTSRSDADHQAYRAGVAQERRAPAVHIAQRWTLAMKRAGITPSAGVETTKTDDRWAAAVKRAGVV